MFNSMLHQRIDRDCYSLLEEMFVENNSVRRRMLLNMRTKNINDINLHQTTLL